jgi:hypothetical protein
LPIERKIILSVAKYIGACLAGLVFVFMRYRFGPAGFFVSVICVIAVVAFIAILFDRK